MPPQMKLIKFKIRCSLICVLCTISISDVRSNSIGGDGTRFSSVRNIQDRNQLHNRTNTIDEAFNFNQESSGSRPVSHGQQSQSQSQSQSLPTGSGGGLAAILGQQIASKGLLDVALTGVQFGLCFYLARSIWKAIVEVFEELEAENASAGFHVDEHDSLLFSEEGVNLAADSLAQQIQHHIHEGENRDGNDDDESPSSGSTSMNVNVNGQTDLEKSKQDPMSVNNNMSDSSGGKTRSKKIGGQSAFASTLATRLVSSGLPLDHDGQGGKSVRSILKTLTRAEGRLLTSALLSPNEVDNNILPIPQNANDRNKRVIKLWDDIGGLEDVKEGLMDIVFPLMDSHIYASESDDDGLSSYYGGLLSNPPGVLLFGPPGCGKTMMVRALAGTANARFLCVSPSTLFRKYVGETNINVKSLFTLARKISPCIIFIDEMEGLFRERRSSGSEEHEVSRELKTEFMQLWDGIQVANDGVVVVGATNRPFDVDSAFLRRMPRSFFVGLPDIFARKNILSSMLSNVPLDSYFNIDQIVSNMEGYTPSDMKEVLRTAALFPLREARADMMRRREASSEVSRSELLSPKLRALETRDVMAALQKVAPTPLTNDYATALMNFASKTSGRSFHQQQPLGNNPVYDAEANVNDNGYFVADLNPTPQEQGNFNTFENPDFSGDDEYSYDDEDSDT